MLDVWLPLLGCMLAAATWVRILKLRERAMARARETCAAHGLQLLDDSVALHRLRLRWQHGAPHVLREYRFYTSLGGDDRQTASITLLGERIVGASIPRRPAPDSGAAPIDSNAPAPTSPHEGKVVPFVRARHTPD